jgi:hypothetical protein
MKTRRQRRKKKKKTKINSILIRIPTTKIAPPHWFGPQPLVLLLLRLLDYVVLVAMAMDTGGLVVVLMTVIVLQVVDNDVSLFMVLYSAVGQNGAFGGACRAPSIHPSTWLCNTKDGLPRQLTLMLSIVDVMMMARCVRLTQPAPMSVVPVSWQTSGPQGGAIIPSRGHRRRQVASCL